MKKFLKRIFAILLIVSVVGVLYAFFVEPNMLTVKTYKIENAPKMKVVVFSDTHFGSNYSQENIERIVNYINEKQPDIVVFVGDFFDHYNQDEHMLDLEYLAKKMREIKGLKFAIRGNHDIGGGIEFMYGDFMKDSGFTLLINDEYLIEELGVNIVGFDDSQLGRENTEFFVKDNNYYNLFLMHDPDDFENITGNAKGLAIAGHTHGGQVYVPWVTEKMILKSDYVKGFYEDENSDRTMFLSSGIGTTGIKARFFNVPEIIVLNFQK